MAEQKMLEPILGRKKAAGCATDAERESGFAFEEGKRPMREPTRTNALVDLDKNLTFNLRLREDLPEGVRSKFVARSRKVPKGLPYLAGYGSRHNRELNITEPSQVFAFLPGEPHQHVPAEVAVWLLYHDVHGAYLEEVTDEELFSVPDEPAPAKKPAKAFTERPAETE